MRQNLIKLKGEIDKPMVIAWDFNTPLSTIVRTELDKINKDIEHFNGTIKHLQNSPTSKNEIYNHFKGPWNIYQDEPKAHGIYTETDHILIHLKGLISYSMCSQITMELN